MPGRGHTESASSRTLWDASPVAHVLLDGCGFTPHANAATARAALFLPLGERQTMELRGGLGLGLAIGKGIIDAHGGRITARSDGPGQGSTFMVDLALAADSKSPGSPPVEPAAGAEPGNFTRSRRRLRVLVVEDHADTRAMLELFLSHRGHEVGIADSLSEGVRRLDEPWDVVLSDLGLTDGSGLEIARRARASGRAPGLLIALTGFGARDQAAASREAGFDDHLVKPVDLEKLCALIERPRESEST